MNYLWAFMILTGVVFAAFHGTLPAVTQAALDSAKEAVTLCITMMGVMSFWVGLMKIAGKNRYHCRIVKASCAGAAFSVPGYSKRSSGK